MKTIEKKIQTQKARLTTNTFSPLLLLFFRIKLFSENVPARTKKNVTCVPFTTDLTLKQPIISKHYILPSNYHIYSIHTHCTESQTAVPR